MYHRWPDIPKGFAHPAPTALATIVVGSNLPANHHSNGITAKINIHIGT